MLFCNSKFRSYDTSTKYCIIRKHKMGQSFFLCDSGLCRATRLHFES